MDASGVARFNGMEECEKGGHVMEEGRVEGEVEGIAKVYGSG